MQLSCKSFCNYRLFSNSRKFLVIFIQNSFLASIWIIFISVIKKYKFTFIYYLLLSLNFFFFLYVKVKFIFHIVNIFKQKIKFLKLQLGCFLQKYLSIWTDRVINSFFGIFFFFNCLWVLMETELSWIRILALIISLSWYALAHFNWIILII